MGVSIHATQKEERPCVGEKRGVFALVSARSFHHRGSLIVPLLISQSIHSAVAYILELKCSLRPWQQLYVVKKDHGQTCVRRW
jgi:hypothetical protein